MIIGYKPQFPAKILAGIKKHTIRQDIHDRWHAGMKMHQSTGVRTKQYKLIRIDMCTGTQKIEIKWLDISKDARRASIYVDSRCVGTYTNKYASGLLNMLAKNDGFESVEEFFNWFNQDYSGKIIHWTDFRY